MTSTRSLRQIELKILDKYVDWERLACLIPKKRVKQGRPPDYSNTSLLRLVVLQDREEILHDTVMARKLKENKNYRQFCKFTTKTPAHDAISRFKRRRKPRTWKKVQEALDRQLEELGYFEDDELGGDGTDIPLPENVKIASWGAKSNKKKFLGLWLMTLNSTKREIVRDFNIGSAKIGQMVLMEDLLNDATIPNLEELGENLILDGIFDTHNIRQTIFRKWNKIPIIPYNPRNSNIKEAKNLPDDNWRLIFTPCIRNENRFKEKSKPRTAVERENGRLKQWTLMGRLKEKAKTAYRITSRYIINQTIISIIRTQITALAEWIHQLECPVPRQTTLVSFFSC